MNSVSLIGRLTRDPDVRYSAGSQTAVAKFTLAVNRPFAKEGEQDADFIGITCFGKTAELVEKYMSKGRQVGVTGRIQTGSYERDGVKHYTTDIVAERVEFLGKKDQSSDTLPKGIEKTEDEDDDFLKEFEVEEESEPTIPEEIQKKFDILDTLFKGFKTEKAYGIMEFAKASGERLQYCVKKGKKDFPDYEETLGTLELQSFITDKGNLYIYTL